MDYEIKMKKETAQHCLDIYHAIDLLKEYNYIDSTTALRYEHTLLFYIVGRFALLLEKENEDAST